MNDIIRIKIDVTKIDKSRLFKGAKGTYLDAALIPSRDSKYGDSHFIVQDVSKEERERGIKGEIIGNARIAGSGQRPRDAYHDRSDAGEHTPANDELPGDDSDSIPF